jgi:hypothetical protein
MALDPGRYTWIPTSYIDNPGGDEVFVIGVNMMYEYNFWVVDAGLGSISGTLTVDGTVPGTDREYVLVALFDDPNMSGEPLDLLVAKYGGGDTYTYAFYNLPDDDYYLVCVMDMPPYGLGEGGPGPEDHMGMYMAPPPPLDPVTVAGGSDETANFTIYP